MKDVQLSDEIYTVKQKNNRSVLHKDSIVNFLDISRNEETLFYRLDVDGEEFLEATSGHLVFIKKAQTGISGKN